MGGKAEGPEPAWLEPIEAIRRIKERDHHVPAHQPRTMAFPYEQALVHMIELGIVKVFLTDDGQLAFWPVEVPWPGTEEGGTA